MFLEEEYINSFTSADGMEIASITMNDTGKGYAHYNDFKKHNYNIIATDYENYGVIYGCDEYLLGMIHFTWSIFLSRTKSIE